MSSPVDGAVMRLSALTGLPLERCVIRRPGFNAEGARISGIQPGKGLSIALTRTMTSAEAAVVPEDSAGGLVRMLGRSAQDDPEAWVAVITDLRNEGLVLTVTVNGEMLDDSTDIPDGLWWGFMIECWARIPASTPAEVEDSLVQVGVGALTLALSGLLADSDVSPPSTEALPEGASVTVQVNRYERSPVNRMRCINHYGATCWVCDLSFEERYGPIGAGFIEVHHRVPLSSMGGEYDIDPIRDLVPLCSNCHSMAHRRTPPYQPSELRQLLTLDPKVPDLPDVAHPD